MEKDLPRSVQKQDGTRRFDFIDDLFNTDCKMGKKVMMACGSVNAGKSLPDNLMLLAWGPRDVVLKHTGFFDIWVQKN